MAFSMAGKNGYKQSKTDGVRRRVVGLMMDDATSATLTRLARRHGWSRSRTCAQLIRDAAGDDGTVDAPDVELEELVRELSRIRQEIRAIGVNVNQIAHAANAGQTVGGDDLRLLSVLLAKSDDQLSQARAQCALWERRSGRW